MVEMIPLSFIIAVAIIASILYLIWIFLFYTYTHAIHRKYKSMKYEDFNIIEQWGFELPKKVFTNDCYSYIIVFTPNFECRIRKDGIQHYFKLIFRGWDYYDLKVNKTLKDKDEN